METLSLRALGATSVAVSVAFAVACGSSNDGGVFDGGVFDGGPAVDATTGGHGDGSPFGDGRADGGAGGGTGGTPCTTDSECGAGGICSPDTHTCGCGGTAAKATPVAPNLLLVLDRSCSMNERAGDAGVKLTKWNAAVDAIDKLTTAYSGKVYFGLTLFPDPTYPTVPKCKMGTVPIEVGPGNESAIQGLLDNARDAGDPLHPGNTCWTNIDTAMAQAAADQALTSKARGEYVALVTDGEQAGCSGGGGTTGILSAINSLAASGVGTFVVGFGASVNATQLDSFATAGGEPNTAPGAIHKFYQATDEASLESVLGSIAQATLGCTEVLSEGPPGGDVSVMYVYFDHMAPAIARDPSHKGGWDYDAPSNTVTFYGQSCSDLKAGKVSSTQVVFGCAGGPPPPPPK